MKMLTIIEQLNGDQFTFYDNRLGTILRSFEGFEYANVKASIDDVAGDYGGVYVNSKHGTRQFSIQGDLISDNVFELRRTLLKALRQTGTIKLLKFTTYDDLQLQCEAEITKLSNPYTHQIHTFLIQFLAPDWRFYSQELKTLNMTQTILGGGTSIPFTIPLDISEWTDSTVSHLLTNEGNEATDPVFTITGPGTGFTIENITTNKTLNLDTTLIGGDEVVIDVKNRTVIKNGTDNLYPDITGDFWSIIPGDNDLRFYITSGSDENTNLNIAYRDAYNGI